jgi:TetR/AcrR family transcriptional regulator, regulator of cefoperazone and chloramphenicol sensitivity
MNTVLTPGRQLERRRYARGEETRARIVATALRIFGEHGYDQTSTRQIAAEADVNPPALQYYFGGKEGLHRACAQYIIDLADKIMAPARAKAAEAIATGNRSQALAALNEIIDSLVAGLASPGTNSWSRFIARGKVDGAGPAMTMIRERIGAPLIATLAALIGLVDTRVSNAQLNRLRALIFLAPMSWLHANRDGTLDIMGWDAFDGKRIELLKRVMREQLCGALRTPKRARSAPK